MIRLPPKPVRWATYRTACLVWAVLRAFAGFASGSPSLFLPASLFLMLGVSATAVADITVARERVLLGNLGVSRRAIAGMALVVSGILEVAAALALRVMGVEG